MNSKHPVLAAGRDDCGVLPDVLERSTVILGEIVVAELAAVLRIGHGCRRQDVVACRFDAFLLPVHHRVECRCLLVEREVAMAHAADRTLHQQVGRTLLVRPTLVNLFHAERHVHVAQGVDRHDRHADDCIGLGHPAQAVGAQAVGVGDRRDLESRVGV